MQGTLFPPVDHDAALLEAADRLSAALGRLAFAPPVTHVYNPLEYARAGYAAYARAFAGGKKRAVFLGMNPGPFGMAQTGVPFGDPALVRGWLGLEFAVSKPALEHPKRPVLGLDGPRSEVSGARVWGLIRDRFASPARFFERYFVENYCPLCFIEESGRNRTPDHLPVAERVPLFEACDEHLRRVVSILEPELVVGVGAFAEARACAALEGSGVAVARVLHPSPSSPAANQGWSAKVLAEAKALGLCPEEVDS
jgi:single-strand selective monofunctional uracil DNA glycosylase